MPLNTARSGTPPAAPDDQSVGTQDPERTPGSQGADLPTADEQTPAERGAPDSTRGPSTAAALVAERTERRHQRMLARESSTATREPDGAAGGRRTAGPPRAVTSPGRQTLRESLSAAVIGMLAAGAALGAILGALSASGWLIGLLVAGLTATLAMVLRPWSRST